MRTKLFLRTSTVPSEGSAPNDLITMPWAPWVPLLLNITTLSTKLLTHESLGAHSYYVYPNHSTELLTTSNTRSAYSVPGAGQMFLYRLYLILTITSQSRHSNWNGGHALVGLTAYPLGEPTRWKDIYFSFIASTELTPTWSSLSDGKV